MFRCRKAKKVCCSNLTIDLLQRYFLLLLHGYKALFFLILGLQIFFLKILRSEEEIKIKITKKIFFFNLKHIWIGEKK